MEIDDTTLVERFHFDQVILDLVKAEASRRGFRYEESDSEVRMIRPDGTLAMRGLREDTYTITAYISPIVETRRPPPTVKFKTLDEMLAIPWVARRTLPFYLDGRGRLFRRFAIDRDLRLIVTYGDDDSCRMMVGFLSANPGLPLVGESIATASAATSSTPQAP